MPATGLIGNRGQTAHPLCKPARASDSGAVGLFACDGSRAVACGVEAFMSGIRRGARISWSEGRKIPEKRGKIGVKKGKKV